MAEPPEDAGASATSPQPRIHPRPHPDAPEHQPAAATAAALAKLAEAVRVLAGDADSTADPETGLAPGRTGQKNHRFQRTAVGAEKRPAQAAAAGEPAATSPPAEADPALEADDAARPIAPSRRPAAVPPTARSSRSAGRINALRQHPFFVWIVVQAFCCGLLLLGVFLGATQSGPGPAGPAASASAASNGTPAAATATSEATLPEQNETTPARTLQTIDLAFAKEDAGDLSSARGLLESLAASPLPAPGIEYQLALLSLRRGDRPDAAAHLARSVAARQAIAPCCYLRAAFAGEKGDYREASAQLQLAAFAEPYNGRYFFYWGEALRRNGKLGDAAACLREALARPLTPDERELYAFKWRLAQVEAGRGDPFNLELEAKLLSAAPAGDWLLLAAAQNLQRHSFAAAAALLERAARLLPADIYGIWVSDYAFQNYASEPEIARYLQVTPPLQPSSGTADPSASATPGSDPHFAAAVPPDPTVCPPAAADPALWRTLVPQP